MAGHEASPTFREIIFLCLGTMAGFALGALAALLSGQVALSLYAGIILGIGGAVAATALGRR